MSYILMTNHNSNQA